MKYQQTRHNLNIDKKRFREMNVSEEKKNRSTIRLRDVKQLMAFRTECINIM